MDAYLTTMYFVDPNIICAGGRTQDMFDTQGTGDRLIIQVQNDNIIMTLSLRLILEGWRYSHWQPRDSSPEQGGGRGWSRMAQSLLLYRDGGSLHPIWLHSRTGLSTDPASSGSLISCHYLCHIQHLTASVWRWLWRNHQRICLATLCHDRWPRQRQMGAPRQPRHYGHCWQVSV